MKVEQFKQHLIQRIKEVKDACGLSNEEISKKTEDHGEYVSPSTVHRILFGDSVKLDTILAVADALAIPYDEKEADDVAQLEIEHLHQSLNHAYERIQSQNAQIGSMRKIVDGLDNRANGLSKCIGMLTGVTAVLSVLVAIDHTTRKK